MDEVELKRQLERAHADCFGWAMACCGRDRDDAEEVLQTVYLTVLEGRARYDGRSTFRTWLFGVIRRTAASERRKTWLRGLLLKREADGMKPEAPASPDAELDRDSRRDSLRHALARLATRQREVLQHAEVERDDRPNEDLENEDELALRDQIRLAGLVNQLGDLAHRFVDGHALELPVEHEAEQKSERADDESAHE